MSEFYTNVQVSKNNILYRGYKNGKRVKRKEEYFPTLFVGTNNPNANFKTLDHGFADSVKPGTIKETKEFIKEYQHVEGFKIYGDIQQQYCYIEDHFKDEIFFDPNIIKIGYIDIEYDSETGFAPPENPFQPIVAISIKHDGLLYVFGTKRFDCSDSSVIYYHCDDEIDLLTQFVELWENLDLDVISGWNIQFFDIPYLINRMKFLDLEKLSKRLSPWKEFTQRNTIIHGKEAVAISIVGISILDYMELYKKFTQIQKESYKLDYISSEELKEGKLSHGYSSLSELYNSDYQKFIEYNMKDVNLVERLEHKMKFIDMAFTLAYQAKVNYSDVFSQVRMWDVLIRNYLIKRNIVIPNKTESSKNDQYAGAYVKDPIIGMHEWIVSFDLASLYPHLIQQFNISPETITDEYIDCDIDDLVEKKIDLKKAKDLNLCIAANGHFFKKDVRGFLPEMMEFFYIKRSEFKKEMIRLKKSLDSISDATEKSKVKDEIKRLDSKQNAFKVLLNSAYGALGNSYFRHYDIRQAEAVTLSGQLVIKWIDKKINQYLNNLLKTKDENYIVAGDTDSIYISLERLVKSVIPEKDWNNKQKVVDFITRCCDTAIVPYIDNCYQELAEYMNSYDQKMTMKREVIADRGIWTAKKRYILNVYDKEGVRYQDPELKIMGLEAIKSSTPHACRSHLKDAMKLILRSDEDSVIQYVDEFKKKFNSLPISEISFPRGVNGLEKFHDKTNIHIKGTPMHVRGALVYNNMLKEYQLLNRYEKIRDGDKLKYIHLLEPNPAKTNVLAFLDEIPKEFNMEKYIDFETQFDKAFMEPLKIILDSIGWKAEKTFTLESFFS